MTREPTLKAIVKITSNEHPIPIANIQTLTARMFELLHKASRTINLNTLEALVSMTNHYPKQFEQASSAILKEILPFITDNDMQASQLALKLATSLIGGTQSSSSQAQDLITRAAQLSKSHLIQGQQSLVNELLAFFQAAADGIQDKTFGELYSQVGLKSQTSAQCIARAMVFSKNANKKITATNDMIQKIGTQGNEVQGCLCLGELGKL